MYFMLYLLSRKRFHSLSEIGLLTFAAMKIFVAWIIGGMILCPSVAGAQFHTVSRASAHHRIEIRNTGGKIVSGSPDSPDKLMDATGKNRKAAATPSSDDTAAIREEWIGRYMSVSYPLRKIRINSAYGIRRDPFTGKKTRHNGIDLHARNDDVFAMMEGVVVKTGYDRRSGNYVTLRHGDYTVSYCHLSQIRTYKGALVRPGEVVGITGSTGRSTGEHLHITVRYRKKYVNPVILLDVIYNVKSKAFERLCHL